MNWVCMTWHWSGVAKGPDRDAGREHFYVPGKASFMLEARDPVLYYVQRLRDEAHRFAIGTHRAKRSGPLASTRWTKFQALAPPARRPCSKASDRPKPFHAQVLMIWLLLQGVSKQLAQAIYDHFHPDARLGEGHDMSGATMNVKQMQAAFPKFGIFRTC